ncbi:MAG TPA: carbohydrate porin [Polyangia bacterium]|jgi:hypothetical protein
MAPPRHHRRRARVRRERLAARAVLVVALSSLLGARALARNPEEPETEPQPGSGMTFVDHGGTGPFWLGGELNSIFQYHPSFSAPYSGTNSLRPNGESALSFLVTGFFAYRPTRTTELIVDPEMALGGGLSKALGIAGFSNLDVVRNPTLSHAPYPARYELHQIVPLSDEWVVNEDRGPISSMPFVPLHRLEFRLGKMSTADLFDINPAGADSHLQFMNWSVDNNGAYDYAADTRGYTYGFVAEYQGPRVEARLGEMLMPKVANGIDLDFDLANSRADNIELELKYSVRPDWRGTVRLLGYQNHANMGSYREAIAAFNQNPAGDDACRQALEAQSMVALPAGPVIACHRAAGRVKRGFGVNVSQELAGSARVFGRFGTSGGANESFAYTEIENTIELGGDVTGGRWHRPTDRMGLAFVSNGISSLHQEYLRLGGLGFLLGDGGLSYARERIFEHYYNVHIWRGAFVAEDVQFITNPGYNAARGPVWVFSLRGHLEF